METIRQQDKFYMAKKYLKKPIPIHAIQVFDDFTVETLEGKMIGRSGDYLIRGIKGELYPCAKSIFEESYEAIK